VALLDEFLHFAMETRFIELLRVGSDGFAVDGETLELLHGFRQTVRRLFREEVTRFTMPHGRDHTR
jgi:hypothetical protein